MNKKVEHVMAKRFRGFLPIVIDIETAGFNPQKDAMLEIAAVTLKLLDDGKLEINECHAYHIKPFPGANLDPAALAFTGIKPDHPFRFALEEDVAIGKLLQTVRQELKKQFCQRAVLVGHNAWFDLSFLNAAIKRCKFKQSPFHNFTSFDTASLAGLAYGQTVLARAAEAAGIPFDSEQAHSAIYDAKCTAELFCRIVNRWQALGGWPA